MGVERLKYRVGRVSVCLAGVLAAGGAGAQVTGYELLGDWSALARSKQHLQIGLASSYDRSGGNDDRNQYLSPPGALNDPEHDGITVVAAEADGPGMITRFWMPHATANAGANGILPLRIFLDGQLAIDTDVNQYLDGQYGYVNGPLTDTFVGGQVSYEPIVFQESMRVELKNWSSGNWFRSHQYYQFNYQTLPTGAAVTPYSGSLTSAQLAQRSAATGMINSVGSNPAGVSATAQNQTQSSMSLGVGQSVSLASLTGSGHVRALHVDLPGLADSELDGLRVRVRYDGQSTNAIDVPASHFFGAGHGRAAYASLPLNTDGGGGMTSYWPMPYRDGVEIELHNAGAAAVSIAGSDVEYESSEVSADAAYLHAQWSEQITVSGQTTHTILDAAGAGHYVGNLLYVKRNGTSMTILEGDEVVTVDGQVVQFGTGLEDAYNGGFYYNHVGVQSNDGDVPQPASGAGPYSGLLQIENDFFGDSHVRTDQYRWYIGDPIPFAEDIDITIENFGTAGNVLFGSTAFYYLNPDDLLVGDANGDGRVDEYDLAVLAANWGDEALWQHGDFSGDRRVTQFDLAILADHWYEGVGAAPSFDLAAAVAAGFTVPEPASLLVFAPCLAVLLRRR
jgi:hypothetical protein